MQDYTTTVTFAASPDAVFTAINDIRGWWSEEVDGQWVAVGDEFTFHGHDEERTVEHTSRIRVESFEPAKQIRWRVLDNRMSFITDQSEWRDTEIRFDLAATEAGAELRFSHVGLVPAYECFEVCSNAWSFFIGQSLRDLVLTGSGSPIRGLEVTA